jgi:nuclear cap-binding protein subunit 1
MDSIHEQAVAHGVTDPLIPSTDAYMTSVCFIGSKSLSHVLSCIERCKERLLAIGPQSEAGRRQIIQSVVSYWNDQAGTAVNIVDKLLNYTIVTPESVIQWALGQENLGNGVPLAQAWRFEMVAATVGKVTNRVRQIVAARVAALKAGMADEQIVMLEETLVKERDGMRVLFAQIDEAVLAYASGSADAFIEGVDGLPEQDIDSIKAWGQRWATTFRRKAAVEEAIVGESAVAATMANAAIDFEREETRREAERQRDEELRQKRLAADLAVAGANGNGAVAGETANGAAGVADLDIADADDDVVA